MARTGRQVQHNPLGQRIMAYRKKMNLTMQQLADQLGISESYISFIESGHRSPSRKLIKKLIHFFYPQGNPHLLDEWLVLAGFSPESPQTLMQLQQAQSVLEAQIHVNPSDLRAQFGLIRNLIKNEQLDQARQQIQLCLQLFHGSVEVQSLIGSLELAKGNFDQAIRAQQLAVDLFKSSESNDHTLSQTDLLLSLGVSYFLKAYDQLAQAQTSSKKKVDSQALEIQALNDFEMAQAQFAQALALDPHDIYVLDEYARVSFNLAHIKQTPKLWKLTIDLYKQVLKHPENRVIGPDALLEASLFLAHAHSQKHDYSQAEELLCLIQALRPDYWLGHYARACLVNLQAQHQNDTDLLDQALNYLAQAFSLAPDLQSARKQAQADPDLAYLRKKAAKAFEKTIKLNTLNHSKTSGKVLK